MVCAKTGIPGASFAALGAFDSFSMIDIIRYEMIFGSISEYGEEYAASFEEEEAKRLTADGYDESEVQEVIDEKYGYDLRTLSIAFENWGLIEDTLHHGVPFEVVINEKDLLARAPLVNSLEGSACSHISRSCDIRWLCFPSFGDNAIGYTFGHSSRQYGYHAASEYVIGWETCDDPTINEDLIFLPGTAKNDACGSCRSDAFCESNQCRLDGYCLGTSGSMPTFCPDGFPDGTTRGPCSYSTDCESGRCEHAFSVFDPLGGACYEKLEIGLGCNEHNDCKSGYCSWSFKCGESSDLFE